ncbi:hypothetical protein [Vibrio harveyi]|uniref:hypothetical protein n=1 Tax=Vibrio harveyi TaxID=669 RepID=UPI001FD1F8CF|nr:hypothetical protein [Vibrio harveyi]
MTINQTMIDYLVNVHTLPQDLAVVVNNEAHDLFDNARIYQLVVSSELLWRVWMIDQDNQLWIEVNLLGEDAEVDCHTLKLDEGTYSKIEYEPYSVLRNE